MREDEGKVMRVAYVNIDGWTDEKGVAMLMDAEREGWDVVGVGEFHKEDAILRLMRTELGRTWKWEGKVSKVKEGYRGVGVFVRRTRLDRVEIWEEEGGAGEEGLWVKIEGIEGGGRCVCKYDILAGGNNREGG